jgi:hypothetical protein
MSTSVNSSNNTIYIIVKTGTFFSLCADGGFFYATQSLRDAKVHRKSLKQQLIANS